MGAARERKAFDQFVIGRGLFVVSTIGAGDVDAEVDGVEYSVLDEMVEVVELDAVVPLLLPLPRPLALAASRAGWR